MDSKKGKENYDKRTAAPTANMKKLKCSGAIPCAGKVDCSTVLQNPGLAGCSSDANAIVTVGPGNALGH